jgi:hypothetical protein
MRTALGMLGWFVLVAASDGSRPPRAAERTFRDKVQPVLAARCVPCHFPGGVMYARLPFDDPQAVRSRTEGVLRRLKGADRDTVAAWLEAGGRAYASPRPGGGGKPR